ncbi:uncharacterized protein LOC143355022 [Halictus rubicundus]|uniref:uncharacterized protein LOC143355022 n=1 Tax=Halictus rubicundus TaxID=77578 RepID=UPI004035D896
MERMINNRLLWWCETTGQIPITQSGFRKGRSATDNILNLTAHIRTGFARHQITTAAFLDVSAAYDNVLWNILMDKLAKLGVPINTLSFIANWSYCRFASSPSFEGMRAIYKGLPQGGVLSPLLYNLYVANIFKRVPKEVHISQYADDIALFSTNSALSVAKCSIEKALKEVNRNLTEIGLELSLQKTNLIVFNNSNLPSGRTLFRVGQFLIPDSHSTRFLGVHLDHRLSFESHITSLHKKCLSALNIIKFLRGVWWGAHPDTLILLYKALIRSRLDYAAHIYFPSNRTLIAKLESIQARAIKLSLGLRMSSPTSVVLAESGFTYLENRALYLGKSHLTKIISNANHISNRYIKELSDTIALLPSTIAKGKAKLLINCLIETLKVKDICYISDNFPCISTPYNTTTFQAACDLDIGHRLQSSPAPNLEFTDFIRNHYSNHLCIFTDGSKVEDGLSTGAAVVCPEKQMYIPFSINLSASVFTAECAAISQAINIFHDSDKPLIICSDSLSAIMSLDNPCINTKTNFHIVDIKQKSIELASLHQNDKFVVFIWIPSHCGIRGNEIADRLAKEATQITHSPLHKIPYTDFRERYKEEMWKDFTDKLISIFYSKGTLYWQKFFKSQKKPWYSGLDLSRELIVRFGRMRTNHVNTRESLARFNIVPDSICECSNPTQNIDHLLWECPLRSEGRTCNIPPGEIDTILKKLNIKALNIINHFCNNNKIHV